ncbi:MAG: hypothetical protein FJ146_00520 [Deltaproteobacteria bacterium]|nr:hypothetical protein [Deltaproteobacteria bacterium]
MAQQKSDNKPPLSPKLLRFTSSTKQSEAAPEPAPLPENLVNQALAIALFDAGAAVKAPTTAHITSIASFTVPDGRRALKVRAEGKEESRLGDIEPLPPGKKKSQ